VLQLSAEQVAGTRPPDRATSSAVICLRCSHFALFQTQPLRLPTMPTARAPCARGGSEGERLFVIDGAKALRAALKMVFGRSIRCSVVAIADSQRLRVLAGRPECDATANSLREGRLLQTFLDRTSRTGGCWPQQQRQCHAHPPFLPCFLLRFVITPLPASSLKSCYLYQREAGGFGR